MEEKMTAKFAWREALRLALEAADNPQLSHREYVKRVEEILEQTEFNIVEVDMTPEEVEAEFARIIRNDKAN